MRVEPLTTILPVDAFIEFDEGLQRHLRRSHQVGLGEAHLNQFGSISGCSRHHADFFVRGKVAYWMKTECYRFSQQELAALCNARLAARESVKNGGAGNSEALRRCMDDLRSSMFYDAYDEITEEEAKQREAAEGEREDGS